MATDPHGYIALHARLRQADELATDLRQRVSHAVLHAPLTWPLVDHLQKALVLITEAHETIRALRANTFDLSLNEERGNNGTRL